MRTLIALLLLSLGMAPAQAERADAGKDALVEAAQAQMDDLTKVAILTGSVVVNKGTLKLTAEKATLRETPEGYQHVSLLAKPAGKATFRQKRDGGADEWVEGEAERIEYDERTQLVTFLGKAQVRQLEGGRVSQRFQGDYLSYDGRREFVSTTASESPKPGSRITLVWSARRGRPAGAGGAQ